jgi:hypothetical protein
LTKKHHSGRNLGTRTYHIHEMKAQKGGKARYPSVFEITVVLEYIYMLLALPLQVAVTIRRYGGTSAGEIIIDPALSADPGLRKIFKLNTPVTFASLQQIFIQHQHAPRLITRCSTFLMQSGIY